MYVKQGITMSDFFSSLSSPFKKIYIRKCVSHKKPFIPCYSLTMDALLKQFNVLGGENKSLSFKKFNDYPVGTEFNVKYFYKCNTKYGTSVVLTTTDNICFNLPKRFEKLFDCDEAYKEWNSLPDLKVTYNGTKNGTFLITISSGD